ncbi:hypothetical protein DL98DRAFT_659087 [Cadophora sp. DSE1049]|nr:hypothetical protein DL98DRAFT_659087 [Cadophora sp. DSE1049]
MSYNVYLVAYAGLPRDHHTIFVETGADGSGYIFQVTGNIQDGMTHGHKAAKKPEDSLTYVSKHLIGTVSHENYARIGSIVDMIPPPKKQFNGPKRIYPAEPIRRCQEWNAEAIQALKSAGVLQ